MMSFELIIIVLASLITLLLLAAPPNREQKYAGFWVRLTSTYIDALVIYLVNVVALVVGTELLYPYLSSESYLKLLLYTGLPGTVVLIFLSLAWFNAEGRLTLGKRIFGLQVVDRSGQSISFVHSMKRTLLSFLDIPGIFFTLFTPKKQTLHDLIVDTYMIRAKKPQRLEKLIIVCLLFLSSFFLDDLLSIYRVYYLEAFHMPTSSMEPTLLVGDFILVDKRWARHKSTKQGDVLVFQNPRDTTAPYIKRCVALGKQTVEIRQDSVLIDGECEGERTLIGTGSVPTTILSGPGVPQTINDFLRQQKPITYMKYRLKTPHGRSYLIQTWESGVEPEYFGPTMVPSEHYFFLGDNRDYSVDSRFWGVVPHKRLMGKAGLIYFSWDGSNNRIRWDRIGKVVR